MIQRTALLALVLWAGGVPGCGSSTAATDGGVDAAGDAHDVDGTGDATDRADTPAETDAPADAMPDAAPDAPADGAADLVTDTAGDEADAEGSDAADAGGTLQIAMPALEVWTVIMMGSGNHAVFTLSLDNSLGAGVTGFHAVGGKVLGADATELFSFVGPPVLNVGTTSGPAFDGLVAAGSSMVVVGHGTSATPDLGSHCGESATLSLDVAWNGSETATVVGGPVDLQCVSK